ncbi:hypothetical protein P7C70_g6173, partial [Phenoliferia sp. Uapishka_3]
MKHLRAFFLGQLRCAINFIPRRRVSSLTRFTTVRRVHLPPPLDPPVPPWIPHRPISHRALPPRHSPFPRLRRHSLLRAPHLPLSFPQFSFASPHRSSKPIGPLIQSLVFPRHNPGIFRSLASFRGGRLRRDGSGIRSGARLSVDSARYLEKLFKSDKFGSRRTSHEYAISHSFSSSADSSPHYSYFTSKPPRRPTLPHPSSALPPPPLTDLKSRLLSNINLTFLTPATLYLPPFALATLR